MTACLALAGCPAQPSYPSTITPIYAATRAGYLWVYDGTGWTGNSAGGITGTSIVVDGSGSTAQLFAATVAGVSEYQGGSWKALSNPAAAPVKSLTIGTNLFAGGGGGVSVLNADGSTWSNDVSVANVNSVVSLGSFTYAAARSGLYVYNGTSVAATYTPSQVLGTSTTVTSVFVDSSGDIIAGTDTGLAVLYDSPTGSGNFASLGLPAGTSINQVTVDAVGNLYAAAGSGGGLYILSPDSSGTFVLAAHVLTGSTVNCVCVDGAGTLYAGTPSGLLQSQDTGSTWATQLAGQNVSAVATTAPLYRF